MYFHVHGIKLRVTKTCWCWLTLLAWHVIQSLMLEQWAGKMCHIKGEQEMLHAHSFLLERFHSIQSLGSLPPASSKLWI